MEPAQTLRDTIRRLDDYWEGLGCLIWQPHNLPVGAGTMNPATFLRVLGPEPWNVAYVEPGIRPDDARYGENPNRMQRHLQYQVILKPDPGNPQELYLDSLAALGVDLTTNDLRFVEDQWESPALGAWGLGWEVWLNGLEITQFTYLQQSGSIDLDPVSVEITYGLDRIAMALQAVQHFRDITWGEGLTYGDLWYVPEVEFSRYYMDVAEVERLTHWFDDCEAEARGAIDAGLVLPAHDYVLLASHLFNVLDARGAIGVAERTRSFNRMRRLAREIAGLWLAGREAAGYPLLDHPWRLEAGRSEAIDERDGELPSAADFVLEVGTEELPVADLTSAVEQLHRAVPELLAELRLEHGDMEVLATPRRLAVLVGGLATRQTDQEQQVIGPPERAAWSNGVPTDAARGFARSTGVPVEQLSVVERGGEMRAAAVRKEMGRPAADVLATALPAMLSHLGFGRSMRWNVSNVSFPRPIRWLVALHGPHVISFDYAGVHSGRTTCGLRRPTGATLSLARADNYRQALRTLGISGHPSRRADKIRAQIDLLAAGVAGRVSEDPELLAEVSNLVEQPFAVLGTFNAENLRLPPDVLITVMQKHQRYFSVVDREGRLMPYFITVANGQQLDPDAVRSGNEAVIRARFADAAYFWEADTALPLEEYAPRLAGLVFQEDVGSVADKVKSLTMLVPLLAERLSLTQEEHGLASRAAQLSKCDMATRMVVDFTSLQGVMGREYALHSGESPAVAQAVFEQYLPRRVGDSVPESRVGLVLALADRLFDLVALFAVGQRPTGAADPLGLRRSALGLVQLMLDGHVDLRLDYLVTDTVSAVPVSVADEAVDELLAFLRRRMEGLLRERGLPADVVEAVLAGQGAALNPVLAVEAAGTLHQWVLRDDWSNILTAYSRSARIVRPLGERCAFSEHLLDEGAERSLYDAYRSAAELAARDGLQPVLEALARLAAPIHHFFDVVLVMTDDAQLRTNRLALLQRIVELPSGQVDLSRLQGF
jgi:glycyl-tRNA synthetase